jgi:hypothetical protein
MLTFDPINGVFYDPSSGYHDGQPLPLPYVPNPGGSLAVSNSTDYLTTYDDTPVAVSDHTYATTVDALLDGQSVFDVTLDAAYMDPSVQAAVARADALLAARGASPAAPALTSSLLTDLGSATTYTQTGQAQTAMTITNADIFGPVVLALPNINIPISDPAAADYPPGFGPTGYPVDPQADTIYQLRVNGGQEDINVQMDYDETISRTVTTTTADTLTQTYDIVGTPAVSVAVPEPSPAALLALSLLGLPLLAWRRRNLT